MQNQKTYLSIKVRYLKLAHRFVILENMVFRRIFGLKRDEVTGV
jgi:hypothetical protein